MLSSRRVPTVDCERSLVVIIKDATIDKNYAEVSERRRRSRGHARAR